tara:strand:+ start:3748 stop:4173 length:426 start_codon:yes stop_codon:yes gene_type:complete
MSELKRFFDNGDETVTDSKTGLIWSKKDSWQIDEGTWLDFNEALTFVDDVNKKAYLGQWDWRLPENEEIEKLYSPEFSLTARSNVEIHISPQFEPGGGNGSWALPFDQQAAFYFSYASGQSQHFDKDFSQGYVRLVRLDPK